MSNEIIFGTQIFTIIGYFGTLFFIYRTLIAQKDATIENIRTRLEAADQKNPDRLLDRMKTRIQLLEEELNRADQTNSKVVDEKKQELDVLSQRAISLENDLEHIREISKDFFCPDCQSPLIDRGHASESIEHDGHEVDIDHDWESFECGRKIADGSVVKPCRGR